jgi:hypothetical protein
MGFSEKIQGFSGVFRENPGVFWVFSRKPRDILENPENLEFPESFPQTTLDVLDFLDFLG